jgi:hypothetical protein
LTLFHREEPQQQRERQVSSMGKSNLKLQGQFSAIGNTRALPSIAGASTAAVKDAKPLIKNAFDAALTFRMRFRRALSSKALARPGLLPQFK